MDKEELKKQARIEQLDDALAFYHLVRPDERLVTARNMVDEYLTTYPDERDALQQLIKHLDDQPQTRQITRQEFEEDTEPGILERSCMTGHITTSAFVLNKDWTKVLVIYHKAYDRWIQPGGHFEGDDFIESAMREVKEETGVTAAPYTNIPIDIDTHAIAPRLDKEEGDHFHHDFIFLAVADSGEELIHQEEEVAGAKWIDLDDAKTLDARFARMVPKVRALIG